MRLAHRTALDATPDDVFALVSDAGRMAACLPGAALEGGVVRGRVDVDGRATYAGRLRVVEVVPAERRVRLSARGTDDRGSAAADVALTVGVSASGAVLDVHTDLVLGGPLARFGKAPVDAASARLLDRFTHHLTTALDASDASSLTFNVSNSTSSTCAPGPAMPTPRDRRPAVAAVSAGLVGVLAGVLAGVLGWRWTRKKDDRGVTRERR